MPGDIAASVDSVQEEIFWREIRDLYIESRGRVFPWFQCKLLSKFNMASSGKWEVVGKGGKKRAPNEGKKNKVKASDIPKAEIVSKWKMSSFVKLLMNENYILACCVAT